MLKIFYLLFTFCVFSTTHAQKTDSLRLVVALEADTDEIERSYGYWTSRAAMEVKVKMFGFVGTKEKHLYKTFTMNYNVGEEAWVCNLPKGYFELNVHSFGFTDIVYPMRLKEDHREEFRLKVDSTLYTYNQRKKYPYIAGSLRFNETIFVQFASGDFAENRAFLHEALNVEGWESLNVIRSHKVKGANAFLVTLDIAVETPLNQILYDKVTEKPEVERALQIGPYVTKAIELYQENPNVLFADPTFLGQTSKTLLQSVKFTQSEELEQKILVLMQENTTVLDKINYIIDKTTPEENSTDQ